MMIPLHVFHASTFEGDSFTYRRPSHYTIPDTSIIYSQYIREIVSNHIGFDIHNCLYAYESMTQYAKENFGDNVFSIKANESDYRAFICEGVEDITYDLRIGSGHLLGSIYGFIDGITYGQIPADSFVTNDMRQHFNEDESDFRSYQDFVLFLKKISKAFHDDAEQDGEILDENLYETIMRSVNNTYQRIDEKYIPNIKEVRLPYKGKEEIMIVADELYLEKIA